MEVTLNLDPERILDGLLAYLWAWAPGAYLLLAAAVSRAVIGVDTRARLRGERFLEEPASAGPVIGATWPVTVPCMVLYWAVSGPLKRLFLPKGLRGKA